MDTLRICFNGHFGGKSEDSNIVLYESTWNDYGYHGTFEFQIGEQVRFRIIETKWLHIARIDGTMKKRHELFNTYHTNIASLPKETYISFPSKELAIALFLNFPLEIRKEIAKGLCFNFGEGTAFQKFKRTNQYHVSILRGISEESFLSNLKLCKDIIFCELSISDFLSDLEIEINKNVTKKSDV